MITASRKQFAVSQPYILKRDRDNDKPTIWWVKLLSPELNALYLRRFAECMNDQGFRQKNLDDRRFLSTSNDQLLAILTGVDNVNYEDEAGKVEYQEKVVNDGSEENTKLMKKILMGLDNDDRTELAEAGTKAAALSDGIKKN